MKDPQFGFQYSNEDLQPIRPLFTTNVIVRRMGLIALLFSLLVLVLPFGVI